MQNATSLNSQEVIEFKGSMTHIIQLILKTSELDKIEAALQQKLKLSAQLIQGLPVVIDGSRLAADTALDYPALKALLIRLGISAFGIKHVDEQNKGLARQAGFMPLSDNRPEKSVKTARKTAEKKAQTLLVDKPVRSGQQIYAKDADLIITNNVGVGAEVMADGHIHIYGSLRGRALAGCNGNEQARIFAHKAKAELVAIAGYYTTAETMSDWYQEGVIEFFLEDKQIQHKQLS